MAQKGRFNFGLAFANGGAGAEPEWAMQLCVLAEEAGFESVWTGDHVVVASDIKSKYPFSTTGALSFPSDFPFPDPMVWLAFVAASTRTLKLGTGIMILPQRNPVVFAKQAATLDALSKGRLVIATGLGWQREETEAIGVPWQDRAMRAEEYVMAMRELWAPGPSTFEGEFVSFSDVICSPQPSQDTIPLIWSVTTEAAAERAGRVADGLFPNVPGEIARHVAVARQAAEASGRAPEDLEVMVRAPADRNIDGRDIELWSEVGVSRVLVSSPQPHPEGNKLDGLRRDFDRYHEETIATYG